MPVRLLRRLTGTAFGPVGSLTAAKRAQPFRSEAKKGVPANSPSNSPILPKTRALCLAGKEGETQGGTAPPGQK